MSLRKCMLKGKKKKKSKDMLFRVSFLRRNLGLTYDQLLIANTFALLSKSLGTLAPT